MCKIIMRYKQESTPKESEFASKSLAIAKLKYVTYFKCVYIVVCTLYVLKRSSQAPNYTISRAC